MQGLREGWLASPKELVILLQLVCNPAADCAVVTPERFNEQLPFPLSARY